MTAACPPARILIVDDERDNRELLGIILAREGFLILTAANGDEAFALLEQHSPDLMIIDVMMPGMNGYEVTARIKSNPATAGIPIIMLTALDDACAKMLAVGAGAEEILTKPVGRAVLCGRVRDLLSPRVASLTIVESLPRRPDHAS